MSQDPYQILGISRTATLEEARTAYRNRVRVLHPDRFDPVSQKKEWEMANQMLRDLTEAWEAIKNRPPLEPSEHEIPSSRSSVPRSSSRRPGRRRRSASPSPLWVVLICFGFLVVGALCIYIFWINNSDAFKPLPNIHAKPNALPPAPKP